MATKRKIKVKRAAVDANNAVDTSDDVYLLTSMGEELNYLVRNWYLSNGLPIDESQLIGEEVEKSERDYWLNVLDTIAEKGEEQKQSAHVHTPSITEKPEFGTPEFWKWARQQREAKNAERAAQGLPPLPTKKELEAEKAKKAAEKEAAKAAKEMEKAKKVAEKEAAKAAAKGSKKVAVVVAVEVKTETALEDNEATVASANLEKVKKAIAKAKKAKEAKENISA